MPPKPDELTAEYVFEDMTTVDPCSLTDLSVFDDLGNADYGSPNSLDSCMVTVETDGGDEVVVAVGALAALDPALTGVRIDELDGGLWVSQPDDSSSFCRQLLVFPDDVMLEVQGSSVDSNSATCDVVEAAMAHVVEVVQDGDIEYLKPKERSLLTVDPCELLSDEDVRAVPGFAAATKPDQSPAKHECRWVTGEGPTRMTVRLAFSAGPEPEAFQPGANENPVGGRQSATNPYESIGDASYCGVETGHILFKEVEGDDVVEVAGLYVRMPAGQVNAGCQAAIALATIAWPELPRS